MATGAAGGVPEKGPGKGVGPSGDVEFVPLDGEPSGKPPGKGSGKAGSGAADGSGGGEGESGGNGRPSDGGSSGADGPEGKSPGSSTSSGSPDASSGPSTGHSGHSDGGSGGSGGDNATRPGPPSDPGPSTPPKPKPNPKPKPPTPATLKVGAPRREAADKRWCEDVTLTFRNTGGTSVRSGSVTLGTHIIGALGVDWGTIEATRKLPAPIRAGRTVRKTWPICVDWWRVPLGMRIETRDVDVQWK
ncbi:hypothetical protein GCM10010349_57120 [Streptomyces flavofungini]|nr:hypothetical protein GCM10010349_57120 [Streptomyces flavofungini]